MQNQDFIQEQIEAAEQHICQAETADPGPFRDCMIDHGARIQRLGKLLKSKADPDHHAEIENAIGELCEMVATLIEVADLVRPLVQTTREVLEATKDEFEQLREIKRRSAEEF